MLENTFVGMHVSQAFSDPSQVPLSRLKRESAGRNGKNQGAKHGHWICGKGRIGVRSAPAGFVYVFPGHHTRLMRVERDAW